MILIYTNPKKVKNKKIAKYGRDLFLAFVLQDGRVIPGGARECGKSGYYCINWAMFRACNPGTSPTNGSLQGQGCTARIIEEGWQMKY